MSCSKEAQNSNDEEERVGCVALIVLCAVSWSAVCDYGIS